ncbi:MAG TPA: NAD(P)/FAD-dependent oxidoreductase [Acidimicrobiia bacterium]|jgi:protoporphyrinogen oxidase
MSRWAIVGGGMLGGSMALRSARAGHQVTLFEAAPSLGGLASAWTIGDVVWDRHYHVTLLSDSRTRELLDELGLEPTWVQTKTGSFFDGKLYSVSNAIEFLKFPPLSLWGKARLASTILYGSRTKNWKKLEQIPVEVWLTRWSGKKVFDRFWLPLLEAKLGNAYHETSAAFIWATIQRLYAARRSGLKTEMFGYVPGGYARILGRLHEVLVAAGVDVRLSAPVESVKRGPQVQSARGVEHFDQVVVTTPAPLAERLIDDLSEEEKSRLRGSRYLGIVCPSVLTRRPLSEFYLTYLHDPAPFTAIVEMSAFVDRAQFGGNSLLYLPKYVAPDDPLFEATDDEIKADFLPALARIHPQFDPDDVIAFKVSRARYVFAVSSLGRSAHVPEIHTTLPGVHVVSSAQILNGTLNVNETLELSARGTTELLKAPEATAVA